MINGKYILDESGNPQREDDLIRWAEWMETASRSVALDTVTYPDGTTAKVSTVFLGLDHDFSSRGRPVLWETMVFGGPMTFDQHRYTSYEDALTGHRLVVQQVKENARGKE